MAEHFVGGDGAAGDFAEVGDAVADVFGEEVAGEVVLEAFEDAGDGVGGMAEGLVVADVGDDDLVGGDFMDVGQAGDVAFDAVDVGGGLAGDVDDLHVA